MNYVEVYYSSHFCFDFNLINIAHVWKKRVHYLLSIRASSLLKDKFKFAINVPTLKQGHKKRLVHLTAEWKVHQFKKENESIIFS